MVKAVSFSMYVVHIHLYFFQWNKIFDVVIYSFSNDKSYFNLQ